MKEKKNIPVFFPEDTMNSMGKDWIMTDPFGSYTGLVREAGEQPVQDADDL